MHIGNASMRVQFLSTAAPLAFNSVRSIAKRGPNKILFHALFWNEQQIRMEYRLIVSARIAAIHQATENTIPFVGCSGTQAVNLTYDLVSCIQGVFEISRCHRQVSLFSTSFRIHRAFVFNTNFRWEALRLIVTAYKCLSWWIWWMCQLKWKEQHQQIEKNGEEQSVWTFVWV